jgi:hypothetical protein
MSRLRHQYAFLVSKGAVLAALVNRVMHDKHLEISA